MNVKQYKREYATRYRAKNRDTYNEYCNKWYHDNAEQQRAYKNEWRRKKVERLKSEGIKNAWGCVNKAEKPKFKEGEDNNDNYKC
jgi:hypothetical protein